MIYLDNHATTACDPKVIAQMMPFFTENYGNPSSEHRFGLFAAGAVDMALNQVASLLGCRAEEIIITSGATESINLALLGLTKGKLPQLGRKNKIVTTKIEHKAVLSPLVNLVAEGWEVEYLPVDSLGLIDLKKAAEIIDEQTYLVTVQLANSEIGTIQPLAELAALSHKSGAFIHCDASQGIGRISVNVDEYDIDFMSFSGHKIYGPKGIGALWIRDGLKRLLQPIMFGGGSAGSIRPGTAPVPLIVGLGTACQLLSDCFFEENIRIAALRDHFEELLMEKIPGLIINGAKKSRLVNNSNLTFPLVDAEMLLAALPDIIISTGSACESGSIEPSRVLTAIGISPDLAYNTIRVGFGRFNSFEQIDTAAQAIISAYSELSSVAGDY